jgi:tRNA/rRNA methyltransferase
MNAEPHHNSSEQVNGPAIVLVEPQLGENIGAAARAMANFGLGDLRLVAPRDGWPNDKARASASRADHVLDAAQLFQSTPAAVADLQFVLATSARNRGLPKAVMGPREAVAELRARAAAGQKSGLLFGRERWGLTNEEIAAADAIVTFPVNPAFASLNIAQAVLLMSYEWMSAGLDGTLPARSESRTIDRAPAPKAELDGLMEHLVGALEPTGYFRSPTKKPTMIHNLRAMFHRAGFTEPETRVFRGVIAALQGRHEQRRREPGGE